MNIVIFGANGPTGRLVTRQALDQGHTAVAVTRRPDDFPITDPALTVAGADVYDPAAVADIVAGADAVVSTLGVPFTRAPITLYSTAAANIVTAMEHDGQRLVVVTSTAVEPTPGRSDAPFALKLIEPIVTRTIGRTTYDDMRQMEAIVRDSGADWTIVRPSGLFDLPDVTNYRAGQVDPVGMFTSRRDLADYLVTRATGAGGRDTVTVSTTAHTPTLRQWMFSRAS